jgi:hypothetical protein
VAAAGTAMSSEAAVYIGLATGSAAVCLWLVVFFRSIRDYRHHAERRASWVLMAGTALLASVGTLASSIGYGMQTGVLELALPQPLFSFIASVGRGALLAAGAIVLTHARPPKG